MTLRERTIERGRQQMITLKAEIAEEIKQRKILKKSSINEIVSITNIPKDIVSYIMMEYYNPDPDDSFNWV